MGKKERTPNDQRATVKNSTSLEFKLDEENRLKQVKESKAKKGK